MGMGHANGAKAAKPPSDLTPCDLRSLAAIEKGQCLVNPDGQAREPPPGKWQHATTAQQDRGDHLVDKESTRVDMAQAYRRAPPGLMPQPLACLNSRGIGR